MSADPFANRASLSHISAIMESTLREIIPAGVELAHVRRELARYWEDRAKVEENLVLKSLVEVLRPWVSQLELTADLARINSSRPLPNANERRLLEAFKAAEAVLILSGPSEPREFTRMLGESDADFRERIGFTSQ